MDTTSCYMHLQIDSDAEYVSLMVLVAIVYDNLRLSLPELKSKVILCISGSYPVLLENKPPSSVFIVKTPQFANISSGIHTVYYTWSTVITSKSRTVKVQWLLEE